MGKEPRLITEPVVIVVEGVDYLHSVRVQLPNNPDLTVHLRDFKPAPTLKEYLAGLLREGAFIRQEVKALGIILDAEESRDSREKSVQSIFSVLNLPVPSSQMQVARGV